MKNQFSGKELKVKIKRRRLLLRDGQENAEAILPGLGFISVTATLKPDGRLSFFVQPQADEATALCDAVERWMQANEQERVS